MTIEIQLTKGHTATVDDIDADLATHKWQVTGGRTTYAGHRRSGKFRLMHRMVVERILQRPLLDSEKCDHINGNSLDNRRANLRLVTLQENAMNRRLGNRSTTGFKGVSFKKQTGRYEAYICKNGKQKHIGYYNTPEEAHEAYCKVGRELHGEFFNPG